MDLHDLTAAYALDALDPDETEAYEDHLGQCERCREELAAFAESATALAWAVESPTPPTTLRGRVLDAAAAERGNVVPLPSRRPWVFRATAAAAAVAACTAVGLGLWANSLSHSVHSERSAHAADARALEILADPASRRATLVDGSGLVAVGPTGEGVLVVQRLRAAPAGKTYEAWIMIRGKAPQPAGLFHGGDVTTVVRLSAPVPRGATVGATVERAGGAAAPTQAPIFSARA